MYLADENCVHLCHLFMHAPASALYGRIEYLRGRMQFEPVANSSDPLLFLLHDYQVSRQRKREQITRAKAGNFFGFNLK